MELEKKDVQKQLEKLYLNNENEVKEIIFKANHLEGKIDLLKFINLEKLKIYDNEITEIKNLNRCPKIRNIYLSGNKLTSIDFLNEISSSRNLEKLTLSNNNIKPSDLTIFSRFTNLTELLIGNSDKEKIKKDIQNRFFGSLKPLENLNKLAFLCIEATDVDSGLDFLPASIEYIHCQTHGFSDKKVNKIKKELKLYNFSIKKWKEARNLEKFSKENINNR